MFRMWLSCRKPPAHWPAWTSISVTVPPWFARSSASETTCSSGMHPSCLSSNAARSKECVPPFSRIAARKLSRVTKGRPCLRFATWGGSTASRRCSLMTAFESRFAEHDERLFFIRQNPPPCALRPPYTGPEAFQLDDLAVIHEQVDRRSIVLDVPGKYFGVGS